MDKLLPFAGFLIVLVVMYVIFRYKSKDEIRKEKELEQSMNDDSLYDFETGEKISLDELSNDSNVSANEAPLQSENEILEYILRNLLASGHLVDDPQELITVFNASSLKKHFPDAELSSLYGLKNDVYIGVTMRVLCDEELELPESPWSFEVLGFLTADRLNWKHEINDVVVERINHVTILRKKERMNVTNFLEFKTELMRL